MLSRRAPAGGRFPRRLLICLGVGVFASTTCVLFRSCASLRSCLVLAPSRVAGRASFPRGCTAHTGRHGVLVDCERTIESDTVTTFDVTRDDGVSSSNTNCKDGVPLAPWMCVQSDDLSVPTAGSDEDSTTSAELSNTTRLM
ncbi:MAG: hypothetical protein MJE68_14330 [Proteobacteria bacterium]|nr:hypothetical protein [Pseudomonadota bacterium]